MNTIEQLKLGTTGEFVRVVQATIIRIATGITHEAPADIVFGNAHERITATGRLLEAQLEAHQKRHNFANRILTARDNLAPEFARGTAVILVSELARRGLTAEAGAASALAGKLLAGQTLTGEEQAMLDGLVYEVIEYGFTSLAGFNPHAWGIVAEGGGSG